MNDSWENIIIKEGEHLVSSNKAPFTLEDEASVWLVRNGAVDVFFIEAENGEPVGMRQHLFRVEAGGALFGISAAESGFVFLAVGTPDTRLARLAKSRFQALASEADYASVIAPMIENWVGSLSSALTRNIYPRPVIDTMLRAEEEMAPGKNKVVSTQREILWLSSIPADSLYIGLEFIPEGKLFPLTRDTWLQMGTDGAVKAFLTAESLKRPEMWDGLALFHNLFIACHTTNINLEKVDEYLKIKDTAQYRDKAMQQALRSLAHVMEPATEEAEVSLKELDPLVAASRLVSSAAKVNFQPPATFKSEKYKDPLRVLLHSSRIRARQVTLKGEWWKEDAGPMLAFTAKERHPVALLPLSPGKYKLFDPRTVTSGPVNRETASELEGQGYTFYRTFPDRNVSLSQLLAFGFASSRRDLVIVVLTGLVASLLGFLVPVFTGIIFDSVIPENQRNMLFQLLAALIVSGVAIGIFQLTRSISMLRIETRADVSLQGALLDRLLKLPAVFYRTFTAGDLATRAEGVDEIRMLLSEASVTILLSGIFSFFNIALLFYYSPTLALWVLLIIVIGIVFMVTYGRYMLKAYRQIRQTMQKLSSVVFQMLTGITKLRSSGTEASAFALWVNRFREMRLAQFRFRQLQNYGTLFYTLLPLLSLTLAYYQFSRIAETGGLNIGMFLAFISAYTTIIASLVSIGVLYPSLLNVVPIYENLKPILQSPPEVDEQKTLCEELKGRIELNHVSFRYRSDVPPVLKDVSIQIAPGEHVALVGPSGGGKSTIVRLLLGFEKPESGTIYFDGQDLSKLDITSVRRQIGTVLQNSKLTTGSIFQNIIGSFAELTEKDAWEAAALVGMEEDIKQMPMGMFTVLSEGGGTISGGQRQRLMLARALVRKPRVVIMDEATSFLDNQTQDIVTRSLDKMKITRIIIAHRVSTIINADTIYVIKDGLVSEKGNYKELVAQKGIFAELVQRQVL